ncbi:MAG: hypothetical protein LBR20_00940 [Propionibacteriaceae bacterium]|jgi:hypothetical protein|nr:hypothetical protein [Propionibacteriaceae bacterium]
MKKLRLYHWSVIAFFLVLPVCAVTAEILLTHSTFAGAALRWFVFFAVGCRLLTAGVAQVIRPSFTAERIFGIRDQKAYGLVRELGFGNSCFGLLGILSLPFSSLRYAASLVGGLYFLMAGIMHVLRYEKNTDERFAMITDLYAFGVIAALSAVCVTS